MASTDLDLARAGKRGADYIERARALAPLLEDAADEIEEHRQLPPRVVEALIEGGFFGWFQSHGAELRLSVRVTVAALLAYAVAAALELPQGYWAVFTAIVVMQASVGGSVKTGIDWLEKNPPKAAAR